MIPLLLVAALLPQEALPSGLPALAAELVYLKQAMTGSFLGVERNGRGEGRGHIVAREVAGGFLARDYWSEARGRRLYAGHDVLELAPDGSARHWWYGSRGDHAEARGSWSAEQLVLVVYDGDDADRRYTYRFAPAGSADGEAFHFTNEHRKRRGWEWFMDSSWRRAPVELPADFRVPERPPGASFLERLAGSFRGPDGEHAGRLLFDDEWLVYDTPREHGVIRARRFGRLDLWTFGADGSARQCSGKRSGDTAEYEKTDAARGDYLARRDTLLSSGYRTERFKPAGGPPDQASVYGK